MNPSTSERSSWHIWNVFNNPIFIMNCRRKLRKKQAMAWGVISFTISAFLFSSVYIAAIERGVSKSLAAKGSILPLLIFQGILLMLLGTGNVASGIALERDAGTLNFQRMTPMSALSKMLGYLFGLPSRQYLMFLTTLPFLFAAIWISGISIIKVLHFYLVFFTTVCLYHMIGMVSGMIAARARRVGTLAMVAILILYWGMPQLSAFGLTFFGFITIIPTFKSILASELAMGTGIAQKAAALGVVQTGQELQFFTMHIHPTVYTLVVQGVLLLTCSLIVLRKWHREDNHSLSKGYAIALFVWVQFFSIGSLWPFLTQKNKFLGILKGIGGLSPSMYFNVLLFAFFTFSGILGLWLLYIVTPSWFGFIKGLRRAKKYKQERIPIHSDAASGMRVAIFFSVIVSVTYVILIRLGAEFGNTFEHVGLFAKWCLIPLFFASLLIGLQSLCERLGRKGFLFSLFFLWIVPAFIGVIVAAAFRLDVLGAYILTIQPIASLVYIVALLNTTELVTTVGKMKKLQHLPTLAYLSVCLHFLIAVVSVVLLYRKTRAVRAEEEERTRTKDLESIPA